MARACLDQGWRLRAVARPFEGNIGGAPQGADIPEYPDADWRVVDLPHDHAIEATLEQNGPAGSGNPNAGQNAWLPGGLLWYRRHLTLDRTEGRVFLLEFGACYRGTEVWVNGHYAGAEANGYFSFTLDITPWVQPGENVIAVRADNLDTPNCRWYTGTGLYRHVWLWDLDQTHLAHHGIAITTPEVTSDHAVVWVSTEIKGPGGGAYLVSRVVDGAGHVVGEAAGLFECGSTAVQQIRVPDPRLWSVDSPVLYSLRSQLSRDGQVTDERATAFGIRTLEFRRGEGFFLNGEPLKFKGLCLHHEAGPLGAAVPETVWAYRLGELKKVGCNAIRTSHNPPAEEFLDLCDALGFLVMDELCDKWEPPHYRDFERRWRPDITAWVRRDRNHPSVVIWSVGNENDAPGTLYLDRRLPQLCGLVRALDPTRPVIAALERGPDGEDRAAQVLKSAAHTDLVGLNYGEQWYADLLRHDPDELILGTENYTYYTSLPEQREAMVEKNAWLYVLEDPRVMGLFYWTGIDYLGEAGRAWPRIGSTSGFCDLTGHPKPRAALLASFWSAQPVLAMAVAASTPRPSSMWSFPALDPCWTGVDGEIVTLAIYGNCETVELTLNGRSLGQRDLTGQVNRMLSWDVPYAPGTLVATGRNGQAEVARCALRTPQDPASLRLRVLTGEVAANGWDTALVEAQLVDAQGTVCPSTDPVEFAAAGGAQVVCVGNGDMAWHGPFRAQTVPLCRGRAVAYLRAAASPDQASVTAHCAGLTATVALHFR